MEPAWVELPEPVLARTNSLAVASRHEYPTTRFCRHPGLDAFIGRSCRLRRNQQAKAIEHGSRVLAQFDGVASMLQNVDIETIWNTATERERRKLVNELVEPVVIHADRLEVRLHETPAITVLFSEVGLREGSGTRPSVSEGGLEPPRP